MILALIVALAAVGFVKSGALNPSSHRVPTVLDAVPEASFAVLTIDVPALRASPLADALTPLFGALGDAEDLKKTCGFDPLERVHHVAIALPEESTSDFGIVIRGSVSQEDLVACAKKAIAARGGSPAVGADAHHPGFVRVRDGGTLTAMSAPELALGKDGPFLVGHGPWLEKMIAAASGEAPSVRENARHMDLRRALGGGEGGDADPRTVLFTVLLPSALRDRLKGEMSEDGGLSSSMTGVLGVESAGIALTAGDAGGTTELAAELRCESDAACDDVEALIGKKRAAWSKDLGVRFIGLGPLLDGLVVDKKGHVVDAHVALPAEDAGRIVAKLLALRRSGAPGPADAARPKAPPPPLPHPDDEVRPRR